MASIYHLGWPGMELLPCIIVDQSTREMYHAEKPLPARKQHLLAPENKFVEFAKILAFFDVDQQQHAMNTFMGISSEYSVRKFFMDTNQKAYISVETLLVYVIIYPKCVAFLRAKKETIRYLQEWLDYPCLECGFIKRSGCLCTEDNPCDGEKTEYVGFCTESMDRQIQTDLTCKMLDSLPPSTSVAATRPPPGLVYQQPPMPPIGTPFVGAGARPAHVAHVMPSLLSTPLIPSARVASVAPQLSQGMRMVAPLSCAMPRGAGPAATPPVHAVAPLPARPRLRDVGVQTRVNFDFTTPRSRARKRRDDLDPNLPALAEPGEAPPLAPSAGAAGPGSSEAEPQATSETPTPLLPMPQAVPPQQPVSIDRNPIKVSLWKLLDSDSDEDEQAKKREPDFPDKHNPAAAKQEPGSGNLLAAALISDEAKPGAVKKAEDTKPRDTKYMESPLSNAKELVESLLLVDEQDEGVVKAAPQSDQDSVATVVQQVLAEICHAVVVVENEMIRTKDDAQVSAHINEQAMDTSESGETLADASTESMTVRGESYAKEQARDQPKENSTETQQKTIDKAIVNDTYLSFKDKLSSTDSKISERFVTNQYTEGIHSAMEVEAAGSPTTSQSIDATSMMDASTAPPADAPSTMDASKAPSISATSTEDASTEQPISATSTEYASTEQPISATSTEDASKAPQISATSIEDASMEQPISATSPEDASTTQPISADSTEDASTDQPISATSTEDSSKAPPVSAISTEDTSKAPPISPTSTEDASMEQPISATSTENAPTEPPIGATSTEDAFTEPPISALSTEDASKSPPISAISTEDAFKAPLVSAISTEDTSKAPPISPTSTEDASKAQAMVATSTADDLKARFIVTNAPRAMDLEQELPPLTIDLARITQQQREAAGRQQQARIQQEQALRQQQEAKQQFKKWYHKFEYVPTQEKLYRCTFKRCGQCFETRPAAVLHNRTHGTFGQESNLNLLCYKCEYVAPLSRWFDMVRHLREGHEERITGAALGCHLCGLVMDTEQQLYRHMDFHYMGRYKCVYCGLLEFTWAQMKLHLDTQCGLKGKREKHLGCPFCPLVFHLRNMRDAHTLAHTDKGLCCAFCKDAAVWDSWTELRKHYQQKHGEKIRAALPPHKDYRKSMTIHKNPECHVCGHESRTLEDFIYHMRKKHDFIPYVLSQCQVCEKTFKSEKMYDWHMKHTHGNEVRCGKCDFVARNDMQLRAHEQSQHVDKEFECSECGKEFRLYAQLRTHMAHHALHTIYNCTQCGAEFKRQRDLRAHTKKEHPKDEEPNRNKCPDCDYECYNKRSLEIHIRRNHPALAEEIQDSEARAAPATPDHGYFNPRSTPPDDLPARPRRATRSAPPPAEPAPPEHVEAPEAESTGIAEAEDVPTAEPASAQPSLKIDEARRPAGSPGKRRHKKKRVGRRGRKRVSYSAPLDEHGDPLPAPDEPLSDKQRHKLELRARVETLKARVKETCMRTRTYEENTSIKQLRRSRPPREAEMGNNTTVAEDAEPEVKRARVSKYGRSISVKSYEHDDTYVTTPRIITDNTNPTKRTPRQHRGPARTVWVGGVAPPVSWADEENTRYPYSDHCYFLIDATQQLTKPPGFPAKASTVPYRIGSGGEVVKRGRPASSERVSVQQTRRKQHFNTGGVTVDALHDATVQSLQQSAQPENRDDMTLGDDDELDSDLLREVSKDPLLQNIIDSMDQQAGQESPTKTYAPGSSQVDSTRGTARPGSLPLDSSLQSPPARAPPPAPGLTPTKQSVIDLLLSKIELNEDQLNKLIEEQSKGAVLEHRAVPQPSGTEAASEGAGRTAPGTEEGSDGDLLSLEQLVSGNIASITRIGAVGSEAAQTRPPAQHNMLATPSISTLGAAVPGSADVAQETEVQAASDTDSNPDIETEMVRAGLEGTRQLPAAPVESPHEDLDIDVTTVQAPYHDVTTVQAQQHQQTPTQMFSLQADGSVRVNPPAQQATSRPVAPRVSDQASRTQFQTVDVADGRGGVVRKLVRVLPSEDSRQISVSSTPMGSSGTRIALVSQHDTVSPRPAQQPFVVHSGGANIIIQQPAKQAHMASARAASNVSVRQAGRQRVVTVPSGRAAERHVIRVVGAGSAAQQRRVVRVPTRPGNTARHVQPRHVQTRHVQPRHVQPQRSTASGLSRVVGVDALGRAVRPHMRTVTTLPPRHVRRDSAPTLIRLSSHAHSAPSNTPTSQVGSGEVLSASTQQSHRSVPVRVTQLSDETLSAVQGLEMLTHQPHTAAEDQLNGTTALSGHSTAMQSSPALAAQGEEAPALDSPETSQPDSATAAPHAVSAHVLHTQAAPQQHMSPADTHADPLAAYQPHSAGVQAADTGPERVLDSLGATITEQAEPGTTHDPANPGSFEPATVEYALTAAGNAPGHPLTQGPPEVAPGHPLIQGPPEVALGHQFIQGDPESTAQVNEHLGLHLVAQSLENSVNALSTHMLRESVATGESVPFSESHNTQDDEARAPHTGDEGVQHE